MPRLVSSNFPCDSLDFIQRNMQNLFRSQIFNTPESGQIATEACSTKYRSFISQIGISRQKCMEHTSASFDATYVRSAITYKAIFIELQSVLSVFHKE